MTVESRLHRIRAESAWIRDVVTHTRDIMLAAKELLSGASARHIRNVAGPTKESILRLNARGRSDAL
jgi:hypothetical protein